MEIAHYQIKFEYIKGIKNTLADTMSRLTVINPDICQDPEPEGHEYGYCVFEKLSYIHMKKRVPSTVDVTLNEVAVSSINHTTDLQLNIA